MVTFQYTKVMNPIFPSSFDVSFDIFIEQKIEELSRISWYDINSNKRIDEVQTVLSWVFLQFYLYYYIINISYHLMWTKRQKISSFKGINCWIFSKYDNIFTRRQSKRMEKVRFFHLYRATYRKCVHLFTKLTARAPRETREKEDSHFVHNL